MIYVHHVHARQSNSHMQQFNRQLQCHKNRLNCHFIMRGAGTPRDSSVATLGQRIFFIHLCIQWLSLPSHLCILHPTLVPLFFITSLLIPNCHLCHSFHQHFPLSSQSTTPHHMVFNILHFPQAALTTDYVFSFSPNSLTIFNPQLNCATSPLCHNSSQCLPRQLHTRTYVRMYIHDQDHLPVKGGYKGEFLVTYRPWYVHSFNFQTFQPQQRLIQLQKTEHEYCG